MRHFYALLLVIGPLVSCTFSPRPIAIEVKWNGKRGIHRAEPGKSDEMGCYFINVAGPGMPQNYGPSDLANSDPLCMGVNSVFGPFDLETLRSGTKIKVIPGNPRTITILGAVSAALEDGCGRHTLPEYFNTASPPQLYALGSTTTRIFIDSAITIRDSYSASTAEDLVRKCTSGGTTGTTLGNGTIKTIKALALESGSQVKVYDYNDESLSFSSTATYSLSSPPAALRPLIPDDFTRYFPLMPGGGSTKVDAYSVSPQRILTALTGFASPNGEVWSEAKFGPNGDNIYALSTMGVTTYRHRNNLSSFQSARAFTNAEGLAVTPQFVYFTAPVSRLNRLLYGLKRATSTDIDGLQDITGYGPFGVIAAYNVVLLVDRTYQYLYAVVPPTIFSFRIETSGTLTPLGSQLGLSNVITYAALTRDGKFLVTAENTVNPILRYTPIANGVLGTPSLGVMMTGTGGGITQITVDPRQKWLFTKNVNNNVTPVQLDLGGTIPFTQAGDLTFANHGISGATSQHLDFIPVFEQN